MDGLIVETMTLNEEESLAAEVKILDSMSEENIPDDIVRSKVSRGTAASQPASSPAGWLASCLHCMNWRLD